MRILVIEDDVYWQNEMQKQLVQLQFELNIDIEIELVNSIHTNKSNHSFDLIFMDIEVGEDNSLNNYQMIHQQFPHSYLCYVTSHTDYMSDAFGINVCGYIVKTDLYKIKQIILKVMKLIENQGSWFDTSDGKLLVSYHDILYFTSMNKKIYMITKSEEIRLNEPGISSLLSKLPNYFVLINKQEIINLDHITFVSRERLDLNRQQMPFTISRRKYNGVIERFMNRIKEAAI